MLSRAVLVVRAQHADAHRLERGGHRRTRIVAAVGGRVVEVRAGVDRARGRRAVGFALEEVELDFERRFHVAQHVLGVVEHAFERAPRAAFEGRAVGHRDVAEHARLGRAGVDRPGQDRKRRGVGAQQHVELFFANEPVDRAAVERHLAVHRALQLAHRNRDVLLDAGDIDEGETNPLHPAVARGLHDVTAHGAGVLNCREHRWRSQPAASTDRGGCRGRAVRSRRSGGDDRTPCAGER